MMLVGTIISGRTFCWKEFLDGMLNAEFPDDIDLVVVKNWEKPFDRKFKLAREKMEKKFRNVDVVDGTQVFIDDSNSDQRFDKADAIKNNYVVLQDYIKEHDYDRILTYEDDFVPPKNSFQRLNKILDLFHNAVFATLHANHKAYYPAYCGESMTWRFETEKTFPDDDSSDEIKIEHKHLARDPNTAISWCNASHMNFTLYKREPWDKLELKTSHKNFYGHDVVFGYEIKTKLDKIGMVDWTLKGSHYEKDKYGNVVVW